MGVRVVGYVYTALHSLQSPDHKSPDGCDGGGGGGWRTQTAPGETATMRETKEVTPWLQSFPTH